MTQINLIIDDNIYQSWYEYAKQAGLSLESMIMEATRYSIQTDRLGVDQARIQELLRKTREAELTMRLNKVTGTKSSKNINITPESNTNISNVDELPTANIHQHNDDSIVNMATLEETVDRNI